MNPNPADVIKPIFSVAKAIYSQVKAVKDNKKQCERLAERIEIVVSAIEGLSDNKNNERYLQGLTKLKECLDECQKFIGQFTNKRRLRKAVLAKLYQSTFDDLNLQLKEAANILGLGIIAQQLINQEQDKQDREQDRKDMFQNQEELLKQHQLEQQELKDIKLNQEQIKQVLVEQEQSFKLYFQELFAEHVQKQKAYPIAKHEIIPYCNLLVNEVIDEGAFGIVYRGTWLDQPVAIKKLKHLNATSKEEFSREVQILSRLRSEYIVRFMGACFEEGRQCIVMTYMTKGSLEKYVHQTQNSITPQQQKQWIIEIASGLKYLHDSGHIHRDLKSANILFDQDNHAKLADFGLTKSSASSVLTIKKESQALAWMAPEIINRTGDYTQQSDVYSLGIVLWEIITRQTPGTNEAAINRAKNEQALSVPNGIPDVYVKIIERCLKANPQERPSLSEIINIVKEYEPAIVSVPMIAETGESLCLKGMDYERQGDDAQAKAYYEKSAEQKYARGLNNLGIFTTYGKGGLNVDKAKGFELVRQAAEQGLARAQFNAGMMLVSGDGVTKDIPKAIEWFKNAAEQGNEGAKKQLAIYQSYQLNLETSFGR